MHVTDQTGQAHIQAFGPTSGANRGGSPLTKNDLEDFCGFIGLASTDELRAVTRSHMLAWRAQLEHRSLAGATIQRKLAAN